MAIESMVHDLSRLKPFLHFEQVCLVGGEPTLHSELPEFIHAARQTGICDDVMVITNARHLHKMPEAFWEALSNLRISIYPNLDLAQVALAESRAKKHGFKLETIIFNEFYSQFKSIPDDGVKTFNDCVWKRSCWTANDGYLFHCPQSNTFFNIYPDLKWGEDGLPLADLTEEKLAAFLDRTEPLKACSHCTGGFSHPFKWRESRDRAEWIKQATV